MPYIFAISKVLLRSCTSLSLLYSLVATCGVMAHGAKTPENILLAYGSSHRAAWLAQLLTGCSLLTPGLKQDMEHSVLLLIIANRCRIW